MGTAKSGPWLQSYGSAQCGLLAVVNALGVLFGRIAEDDAGRLQAAMARAQPGWAVCDYFVLWRQD